MPSVVVEFAGLPGAGKSTLCALVAEELKRRGESVETVTTVNQLSQRKKRILRKLPQLLWGLLGNASSSVSLLCHLASSGQPTLIDFLSTAGNLFFLRGAQSLTEKESSVYLFDQGFLQAIWSVNLKAKKPLGEKELASILAPPAKGLLVVILIDASAEDLHSRLRNRDRLPGRFVTPTITDIQKGIETMYEMFFKVQQLEEKGKNLKTIRVDNTRAKYEDILSLSRRLTDKVVDLLSNQTGSSNMSSRAMGL